MMQRAGKKAEKGGARSALGTEKGRFGERSLAAPEKSIESQTAIFGPLCSVNLMELPLQAKAEPNRTGMPDRLKEGIEALSGMDMSDVRVHPNSDKPTQLNALAYTQGNLIHLAPGQERHLPHEAWHVVQQKQGRVRATIQMNGFSMNNEAGLEEEADLMGACADQFNLNSNSNLAPFLQDSMVFAQGIDIYVEPRHGRHFPHRAWHVVQQQHSYEKSIAQSKAFIGTREVTKEKIDEELHIEICNALQKTDTVEAEENIKGIASIRRILNTWIGSQDTYQFRDLVQMLLFAQMLLDLPDEKRCYLEKNIDLLKFLEENLEDITNFEHAIKSIDLRNLIYWHSGNKKQEIRIWEQNFKNPLDESHEQVEPTSSLSETVSVAESKHIAAEAKPVDQIKLQDLVRELLNRSLKVKAENTFKKGARENLGDESHWKVLKETYEREYQAKQSSKMGAIKGVVSKAQLETIAPFGTTANMRYSRDQTFSGFVCHVSVSYKVILNKGIPTNDRKIDGLHVSFRSQGAKDQPVDPRYWFKIICDGVFKFSKQSGNGHISGMMEKAISMVREITPKLNCQVV